jgi:hypothetical protein
MYGGAQYTFYAALATQLSSMPQLENLECGVVHARPATRTFSYADAKRPILSQAPDAMTSVTQAAMHCKSLKSLKLFVHCFTKSLGIALAKCVKTNTKVECIELACHQVRRLIPGCGFPRLSDVVKKSCLVQTIQSNAAFHDHGHDPNTWSLEFERELAIMLRLNRAGRRYMLINPSNQFAGFKVLALVKDSLDCIYFHLRENPSLCKRGQATGRTGTRRRWADLPSWSVSWG